MESRSELFTTEEDTLLILREMISEARITR